MTKYVVMITLRTFMTVESDTEENAVILAERTLSSDELDNAEIKDAEVVEVLEDDEA